MALEKQLKLRKVEFIFTDDKVNPIAHCEYDMNIVEDGKVIARQKHRESKAVGEMRQMLSSAKEFVDPRIAELEAQT